MEITQAATRNTSQLPQAPLQLEAKHIVPSSTPPPAIQPQAFYRIWQILGNRKANPPIVPLLPISRSQFYLGIKNGIYPAPKKISVRVSAWLGADIIKLFEALGREVK